MRLVFGALNVLASLIVGFFALVLGGMGCDEGCGGGSGGWTEHSDSWQWNAVLFLGLAIFVSACVLFVLLGRSDLKYSLAVFTAEGLFAGLLLLVIAGSEYAEPYVTLGVLAPVLFGAASVTILWGHTRTPTGA